MKTYISLFSSAGIGCYGFKMEGFECNCEMKSLNAVSESKNPIINVNIPRATSVVILPGRNKETVVR
jgi:hypothetical protein